MSNIDTLIKGKFSGVPKVSISNRQILIIDDFSDMRMAVRRMLRDLGEESADFASNGKDAISKMKRTSYDIVLCDYNLGDGKDGQQILEEAHHLGLIKPSCIFIMITAEISIQQVLGAVECQPDDYIAKPFTKELLQHRLANVLLKKDDLMEIYKSVHAKRYAEAITMAESRLSSKSKYMLDIAKLLGDLYLKTESYEKAVDFYQKIMGQKPFPWAKFGLGRAYYYLGEYDTALSMFDELISENQYYMEAYDWAAKCGMAIDDTNLAQEKLTVAARLSPKTVSRQRNLGEVAKQNGDVDVAASAYRSAIQYGVHSCFKSAKEYLGMNDILMERGDTLKALSNLKEARDILKETPVDLLQVVSATANVHIANNSNAEANRFLQQAEQLYQANAGTLPDEVSLDVAETALKLGDLKFGKAVVSSLAENNHDDDELLGKINNIIHETGHTDELSEIIEKSTQELRALNKEGIKLAESGKLQESLALLEKASDKAPNSKAFNLNAALACILLMQENGVEDKLLYKARRYLDRVEKAGKADKRHAELSKMLATLRKK